MNKIYSLDMLTDIIKAAVQYADRPAFVIEEETYTYSRLLEQAVSISYTLRNLKKNVIGIAAENRIETYASILAVLLAKKTYVILHPDYPAERNRQIARQAGIGLLLYGSKGDSVLPPDVAVRRICTSFYPSDLYHQWHLYSRTGGVHSSFSSADYNSNDAASEAPAYIIFTSGSTGEPKGVPISRRNLNAFYAAYKKLGWKLDDKDRMLQMFELTFDVSVVSILYPLTLGACVYTVPRGGMKYLNVIEIMERHRLTFAAVAPSVLRLSRPYFSEITFPHLRYLVVTAEATDVDLLAEFRPCIPHATVVNLYGPTEATIYCTSYIIPDKECKHHNGMAAIGKPFDGVEAIIADEAGIPLPANETGELWIRGPQLMRGYWNAPEKSAQCFVRNKEGKLYYRTGDLCLKDTDGDIIYCGRKDTQVKIQGFRIELGEIEYRVKQFYANTVNTVVLPVYNADGTTELHLVIEQEKMENIHELEADLRRHLPSYMLPKCIHLLNNFPLNASNKTDRKKIVEIIKNRNEHGNNRIAENAE